MKKIIIIGCCLLITNILLGVLLSKYAIFNICLNSVVIIITTALIALLDKMNLSPAFKISLSYIWGFIGILEYICVFFSKCTITDNWVIITNLILLLIQILILIVVKSVSSKLNR